MNMTLAEKKKRLDKLADAYNKKKGCIALGRLSENEELKDKLTNRFILTPSLNVNAAMGGGFPIGKTTIISGDSDSGKTFLCLETIGKKMKEDPNFVAGWLESEKSLNSSDLELFGIDLSRFYFSEMSTKGGAEEALDIVENTIASGGVDMYVINSLKCLVPKEELEKGMGDVQVGLQARMNSKMMRKLTTLIGEQEVAFVLIQHLTTQIGGVMMRDPKILAGGQQIRYNSQVILDLRKKSLGDNEHITREEGTKIGVTVRKNHVVTDQFPYKKTDYYAVFGEGIEIYIEALDLAIEAGLINKSGGWLSMIDQATGDIATDENGVALKWNGKAKFRNYCKENPEFFNNLRAKLNGSAENASEEEIEEFKKEEEADIKLAKKIKDADDKANKKASKKDQTEIKEEDDIIAQANNK